MAESRSLWALAAVVQHIALFTVMTYLAVVGFALTGSLMAAGPDEWSQLSLTEILGFGLLVPFAMMLLIVPYAMAALVIQFARVRSPLSYALYGALVAFVSMSFVAQEAGAVWAVMPAGAVCGLIYRFLGGLLGIIPGSRTGTS